MTDSHGPGYPLGEIEAARMLLEKMGISPTDLLRTSAASPGVPDSLTTFPASPKRSAPGHDG